MPRPTTRDADTELVEWQQLLHLRRDVTLPCEGGTEWTSDDPKQQRRAAALCRGCAVLAACANYATAAGITEGTWGGTTAADRARDRRRRRRRTQIAG